MQSIPVYLNDYGEIVLEIDRLIKADRASLSSNAPTHKGNPSLARTVSGPQPSSVCQMIAQVAASRETKPRPTLWQNSPPTLAYTLNDSESPCNRGSDQRQARLFKTRFCSYGLDCPYLAKGKCLYAHNKEEIRFRPPPPTGYRIPASRPSNSINHDVCGEKTIAPDQSPTGSHESVWSLPESPSSRLDVTPIVVPNNSTSLFDCLVTNDVRSTIGACSPSLSSILGGDLDGSY